MHTETAHFDGIMWTRYPESERRSHRVYFHHHFENKKTPVSLHRYKYEKCFGRIPKGFHVHHKDGNPLNNDIDNLEALSAKKHMSDHGKTNEWNTSGKVKKHLASVSDLAAAWHGSKDGIAWHREHGKKTWETREKIQKKCEECGVAYSSYWKRSRHCGANCYARYYRRERMK